MGALWGLGSPSWQLLIQLGSTQCPSSVPPWEQIRHGHVGPKLAPTSDTCPGHRRRGRRSPGHPAAAGSCPGLRGTGRAHQLRAGGGPAGPALPPQPLCHDPRDLVVQPGQCYPDPMAELAFPFPPPKPLTALLALGTQLLLAPTIRGCQVAPGSPGQP